jgi:hypothetical protein
VTAEDLSALAAQLLENLLEDVQKCTTREEHIRTTARANEAHHILTGINQMFYSESDVEEETDRTTNEVSSDRD